MIKALLGGLLYGLVVAVLLYVCFMVVSPTRRALFRRNRPAGERRRQLISEILTMRRNGATYRERLAYLRKQGFRRDVADELLGEAEQLEQ